MVSEATKDLHLSLLRRYNMKDILLDLIMGDIKRKILADFTNDRNVLILKELGIND